MIALAGGGETDPGNALNPCGLVVDWLRSCYRVAMVVRTGDPAILVDWYKADDNAKCLPGWSRFRSSNWECTREELASQVGQAGDLGEQPGPRTWRRKDKPSNGHTGDQLSLDCATLHQSWWSDGLGPGDDTGPFDANLVPLCCTQTTAPCGFCPDGTASASLKLTITDLGSGCSCLVGDYVVAFDPTYSGGFAFTPGAWTAPLTGCSPAMTLVLFCNETAPGWIAGITDTPNGSFGTFDFAAVCSPFSFDADLDLSLAGITGCTGTIHIHGSEL